ncbi:hypothetical protein PITCH_A360010 [uncultured Desulfobacterium sp.]|uniref:Uncharacterized protein n=1 Tax=uncultured Desulfobacterium sp. TaxID=201089 RepID=A0A445MZI3_9BACT|nr:hypothetical protein PITCH_A360010 [uncultured Desulfobacterium sp.]
MLLLDQKILSIDLIIKYFFFYIQLSSGFGIEGKITRNSVDRSCSGNF